MNDNQDGRIVVTTTMAEKLKAISLIVAMLDVSMPSQQDAYMVPQKLQHSFQD